MVQLAVSGIKCIGLPLVNTIKEEFNFFNLTSLSCFQCPNCAKTLAISKSYS